MAKSNIGIKNAIKSADFRPKRLTAKDDAVRELFLGTLIGRATKTFFQADISDPTDASKMQEGILGVFKFTDAETGEDLRSSKLWIPDSLADMIKSSLRAIDEETGEVQILASSLDIAFEVYAIRSTAPLGYTWKFTPLFPPEEVEGDPLVMITRRLEREALPAPAEGSSLPDPVEPSPTKAKAKAA